jgi:hypothetical protein
VALLKSTPAAGVTSSAVRADAYLSAQITVWSKHSADADFFEDETVCQIIAGTIIDVGKLVAGHAQTKHTAGI